MWQPTEVYWGVLIAANTPAYLGIGKVMFDDWHGFFESVRFWLTPDIISMFRGEWSEDWVGEFKLAGFILLCALLVFGEHMVMAKLGLVAA